MNKPTSAKQWQRWLQFVLAPGSRPTVELMGLPGHLRLPSIWKAEGCLARHHLIYLVTEGRMLANLGRQELSLGRGSLLWVRPGTRFHCRRADQRPLSILRCRLRWNSPGKKLRAPDPWRTWSQAAPCLPWLELLVREADQPGPWHHLRLRSLLGGLFTEMGRLDLAAADSGPGLTSTQRTALNHLLAGRPDARATCAELAAAAGLSRDYFSRCFQRTFGCSPRRWLVQQRIQLAMLRLTETDLRIGEIADELGYSDLFLFSRQFKSLCGVSPLDYRKRPFAVPRPKPVRLN